MPIHYNRHQAEIGAPTRAPGRYPVKVLDATEGVTKKGDPKIDLKLGNINGKTIGWDTLTFGENPGIAHKKLQALGVDTGTGEEVMIDASSLIGRRCFVTFVEEVFNGKKRLKPDFGATASFGYESLAQDDQQANDEFEKSLTF